MKIQNEEEYLNIDIGEVCYYLFWMIMLIAKGTGLYEGMIQYNICLVLAMLCLCGKLLLTRYQMTDLCWMVLLALYGLWIYFHSGDQSAFILIAVMIGLKNIKLSRVFQIGAAVWGICFCYMILRTFGGGNPGPILAHEKLGLGPILRWSLGYTHPNVLHVTYVVLAAFLLYLWNWKPSRSQWGIMLWLMAGNVYVFLYSVSFTGFLLMTLLLAFNLRLCGRRRIVKMERILLQCVFPACILFSVVGPMVLDGEGKMFQFLTNALNNRYSASKIYFRELGISLWGIRVPHLHGFAIDCSYVEALLSYGCIFFLLIVAGYLFTINYLIKKEWWSELAIMLALLVAGVSEPFLFNTSFKNITVLFVGEYLFIESAKLADKKDGSFWNRECAFLSGWNQSYQMPVGGLRRAAERLRESFASRKKAVVCVAAAACLVCGALGAKLSWQPDSIFVGIASTDCADQEEKYLDAWNLPGNFNSAIYEYVSPEDPLYEFGGNMLTVEYVRKIISAGVWGAAGIVIVYLAAMTVLDWKRAGKRKHLSR